MASFSEEEKKNLLHEFAVGEEIIKKEINKSNKVENGFNDFGLLNKDWFNLFIKDQINESERRKLFSKNEIRPKKDERDYSFCGLGGTFNFPSDFVFATKNFMKLIAKNFNSESEKVENYLFSIIIGGECIIMRNRGDTNGDKPYSYIIIHEENKKEPINNIDFILKIDDRNEREIAQNFILNYK